MIQRIQTVYLALAALLLIVPVVFPGGIMLVSMDTEAGTYMLLVEKMIFQGSGELNIRDTPYGLIGVLMVSVFLSVYGIMQYKNRKFQMKLVQAAILLHLIFGALLFFYADGMTDLAQGGSISYSPVLSVLLVNIVLYILALRGIKKDDELVRSADRLR
jgi:hypothetical protein